MGGKPSCKHKPSASVSLPVSFQGSRTWAEGNPQQCAAGTHLYTWMERDNVG